MYYCTVRYDTTTMFVYCLYTTPHCTYCLLLQNYSTLNTYCTYKHSYRPHIHSLSPYSCTIQYTPVLHCIPISTVAYSRTSYRTKRTLPFRSREYFQTHGSIQIFGFPLDAKTPSLSVQIY
jgi:hypothetical protein